jgi:hypothetical protein
MTLITMSVISSTVKFSSLYITSCRGLRPPPTPIIRNLRLWVLLDLRDVFLRLTLFPLI